MTNNEQIMGLIRHTLTVIAGILVTKGTIDESGAAIVVGSVMALVGFVWSWKSKTKTA